MKIDHKQIKYRKAVKDDVALLVDYRIKFLVELQGKQTAKKTKILHAELTNYFEQTLADNTFIAWIAEINDSAVGFGGMIVHRIPGNFDLLNGLEGYILNMYTVPKYRNNGICSEILEKLIDEGKKISISKIYLQASDEGIELYRKRGFAEPEMPVLDLNLYNE